MGNECATKTPAAAASRMMSKLLDWCATDCNPIATARTALPRALGWVGGWGDFPRHGPVPRLYQRCGDPHRERCGHGTERRHAGREHGRGELRADHTRSPDRLSVAVGD